MAKDIIERMGSYTEISPSGTGIRIIFTTDRFSYDKDKYYINNQKLGLEVYVSGATNKFVTITGNSRDEKPVIDGTAALKDILDLYMQRTTTKERDNMETMNNTSAQAPQIDCDYLENSLKKDKKLQRFWNGERPLRSESENDLAFMSKLLYWTNGDIDKAISAFMISPYTRQKDPKHLKKLERPDYLRNLVKKAMPNKTAAQSDAEYQAKQKKEKQIQPQQKSSQNLKIVSAQELQKADLPPVKYLIEDILPEGTSILTAASKIGKSWMVLDMGLKISSGNQFLTKNTEKVGVIYLALEDSFTRLQGRMNKVLNNATAPESFYFLTDVPSLENGLLQNLEALLGERPDIKLIIIDTFQKIRGQALPRENAYQQDYREMGMIKTFAEKNNISVFIVHHNRKMKDRDDPFNMISGTNGIMGAADTVFVMTKTTRNDNNVTLHMTGRDVLQSNMVIQFDKTACKWEVVGNKEEIDRKKYENNPIVKIIRELVHRSSDGCWKGTASNLITEGEILNICLDETAQEIGYKIKTLKNLLMQYDGIQYDPVPNGNAGKQHCFRMDKKIPAITSADEDAEDYSDVEF